MDALDYERMSDFFKAMGSSTKLRIGKKLIIREF